MEFNFKPCPVCHQTDVMIVESGEALRDTLTGEMWFISTTDYYCQCRNRHCIHESDKNSTKEGAVELWNHGEIALWERNWIKKQSALKFDFLLNL